MTYWKICLAWLVVYAAITAVLLMDLLVWRPG
jgi:hypothetical protein